jgi:hypothetical protein
MFDGLFAAPAGIVTASFPVSHKYTRLLTGVLVLIKFAPSKALYAVAADRSGAMEPLWHPLKAQLFVNIGCISFEKLTVVVIAGELSIGTVVVLVQLFSINTIWPASINPIINIFFDMILILNDKRTSQLFISGNVKSDRA